MSRKWRLFIMLICVISFVNVCFILPDGLHPTPPMGWSSWNTFFGPGSEKQLMDQVYKFPNFDI